MKAFIISILLIVAVTAHAQEPWLQRDSTLRGVRNGIVAGIWPGAIESLNGGDGGPRGLLRIGYSFMGIIYHINYIAIEPVVKGKMEFSEISPSAIDGKWGKFMWMKDTVIAPDAWSMVVRMEKFANGAHPFLVLSIYKEQPEELCIAVFSEADSEPMDRCGITATMGNYARLRKLYLKDTVIHAGKLYAGYNDIDFIEKEPYPLRRMLKDNKGNPIVIAETDESFASLASWPQEAAYLHRWNWRYRPFYKLTQYWRKDRGAEDASLQVRVNGRAKYWAVASRDPEKYINIPGGVAFENFELRERYVPGQKVYFGMSRKTPEELLGR